MQEVLHVKAPHSVNSRRSSRSLAPEARHTFTHLTYSRRRLIDIAMETIKITKCGEYVNSKGKVVHLKQDLDRAVESCVHYAHEFDFDEALKKYDSERERDVFSASDLECFKSRRKVHFAPESRSLPGSRSFRFEKTSFLVVSASWLEAASELLNASTKITNKKAALDPIRVGVLNSASGTTPGGRFLKGTVSQEDCLCRASLLYSCISQPKFQSENRYYGKNRSCRYGSSNCAIFSPDVPVIREDTIEGKLLDEYQKVSFVTIPAPNAFTTSSINGREYNEPECNDSRNSGVNGSGHHRRSTKEFSSDFSACRGQDNADESFEKKWQALQASLSDRIHRALAAFVLGNCTDLVLPAFGCGVHGNDPSMVASVFREMLTDPDQFGGRFRTVVFAIPPSRKQNYQTFATYFQPSEISIGYKNAKQDATTCRQ